MPELPDIELYVERLNQRILGERLEQLRVYGLFVLRSVGVAPAQFDGRVVRGVSRLGKRIVIEFEGEFFVLVHLMIAGRLQWTSPAPAPARASGKVLLCSLRFPSGQLSMIETSTRKRAGLWLIQGRQNLDEHRRGGLDVLSADEAAFEERLKAENRTLKRALTNPRAFDGIGNAYSDEILFAARLSPIRLTRSLDKNEVARLLKAAKETLLDWKSRLRDLYPNFPKPVDVTAFRPDFSVHGRYGQPCPVCGAPIQRIVYAENETNYCARCQNEGRLLADRSLSRLLKDDWPKTLEEMTEGPA